MDHVISIKLTEEQYTILKGLAKKEYRTLGNTYSMLAAYGIDCWLETHEAHVEKNTVPGQSSPFFYSDKELREAFGGIPLNQ